ncbi:MAG: hypothetical protein OSJ74_10015 [Clostridia bacterium]|nr:hypothetical protein [Clostridia bacterium]
MEFDNIRDGDGFKRIVMNQIELYEEERVKNQAQQMANAMMGGMASYSNRFDAQK